MSKSKGDNSEFLLRDLNDSVKRGQAIFIAGAGVSISASSRALNWMDLIRDGADRVASIRSKPQEWLDLIESQIKSQDMTDILAAAKKVRDGFGAPGEFLSWLRDTVGDLKVENSSVLDSLAKTGCLIATTNYDSLLSDVTGRPPVPWTDVSRFQRVLIDKEPGILHIHGHWQSPDSVVLGSSDYYKITASGPIQQLLQATLVYRTVVFVGCGEGLDDPNIAKLIEQFDKLWASSEVRHFRLVRSAELGDALSSRDPSSKLFPISYGSRYEDLAPFLLSLSQNNKAHLGQTPVPSSDHSLLANSGTTSHTTVVLNIEQAVLNDLDRLRSEVSESVSRELQTIKVAWTAGRKGEAIRWLEETLQGRTWQYLGPQVKANILLFGANIQAARDPAEARRLLEEAKSLDAKLETTHTEALIFLASGDLDKATDLTKAGTSPSLRRFHASLLLEQGKLGEAKRVLDSLNGDDNVETFRLNALLALLQRKPDAALEHIESAEAADPGRESVRYIGGVVRFYAAHRPEACPRTIDELLLPIGSDLFPDNPAAHLRLREAKSRFASLVKLAERQEIKRDYATWLYATLVTLPDQKEDARQFAEESLTSDPGNSHLVRWCILRGKDVDLSRPRELLEASIRNEPADLFEVLTLCMIYNATDRHEDTLRLLQASKSEFSENPPGRTVWLTNFVITLIFLQRFQQAEDLLAREDEHQEAPLELYLELKSRKGDDLSDPVEFAFQYYSKSRRPEDLLLLAELKQRQGDWGWIIENEEELSLADLFRGKLIVGAAYFNKGQWTECLDCIERLPFTNALSEELRIRALLKLGKLSEAEQALNDLIQQDKKASTLPLELLLAQRLGDHRKLLAIAPRLLDEEEVDTEDLVVTAKLLTSSDRSLTMALLERAADNGIPDRLVSRTLGLCFQLGDQKSEVFQHLMKRASHLAKEGAYGLSEGNLEQFKAFDKQAKEATLRLQEAYLNGDPVHIVLSKTKRPFVLPYHTWLSLYEKQPYPSIKTPLFIRNGRRDQPVQVDSQAKIHADVTAIILAQHFGLLDEMEDHFAPIGISSFLQTHLTHMIVSLSPNQPDIDEANRELLTLVDSGRISRIEIEADVLEESVTYGEVLEKLALSRSAVLLTCGRLSGDCRSATLSDLLEALTNRSLIPGRKVEHAKAILGESEVGVEFTAFDGEVIATILDLRQLLQAEILDETVRHLNLVVPSSEVNEVRSELEKARQNADTIGWLEDLQRRIGKGLGSGKYRQTSALPSYEWREIELAGLEEFFRSDLGTDAAFWVDDRGLTKGLVAEQGATILGTFDLLANLRTRDIISGERYYELINRMRASNLHFLPVSSAEILHWLTGALSKRDAFMESHELRVLRQNLATSLVQAPRLETPIGDHHGEWAYFLNHNREVVRALIGCFKLEEPLETRVLRANWLLENLWVPHPAFRALSEVETSGDNPHLYFQNIGFLFVHGYAEISGLDWMERQCRVEYFDWIWQTLVAPNLPCNVLLEALVCRIKTHLLSALPSDDSEISNEAAAAVIGVYCQDLPEELSWRLSREPEFFDRVGPVSECRLHLDGHQFSMRLLLDRIGRFIQERVAVELADVNQFNFILSMSDLGKVSLTRDDQEIDVPDTIVGLAQGTDEGIDVYLEANLERFDTSPVAAKAKLNRLKTAFEKFELTQEAGQTSPAVKYFQVSTIARNGRFLTSMLAPAPTSRLLERYRLDSSSEEEFVQVLESAAAAMCAEGLQLAWDRLTCFPTPVSKTFREHLLRLPPAEIKGFLEFNLAKVKSPMRTIHLIGLVSVIEDAVEFQQLGNERLRFLVSQDGLQLVRALTEAAKWSANRLCLADEDSDMSTVVALAWAHAEELLRSLLEAGCPAESVLDIFVSVNVGSEIILENFSRPRNFNDLADPKNVSSTRFLLSGAAWALEHYDLIPEDIIDSIRPLVFPEENSRVPNPGLLHDCTGTNSIASWLGDFNSECRLLSSIDSESVDYLAPTGLVNLGNHLVSILDDDVNRPNAWLYLYWILEARLTDGELLGLLEKILSRLDLEDLLEAHDDLESRYLLLTAILGIAGYCQEESRQQLLSKLTSTLRSEKNLSPREENFSHPFLIGLSNLSAPAAAREKQLAFCLTGFLSDFPQLGESLRLPLVLLCFHGPRQLATELWPVLNLARAY